MWQSIINFLQSGLSACFSWFDRMLSSIPGSWDTIFTFVTIILVSRFVLAPIVGNLSVGSDRVKKSNRQSENDSSELRSKDV